MADDKQRKYDRLLSKQLDGSLTAKEKRSLEAIDDESRRLTLKKAHAAMLLKWRGYALPRPEELSEVE